MATQKHNSATKLRRLREQARLTLRELSIKVGVSYATISHHERGLSISAEHAHLYAQYFNVPVSTFWTPPTLPNTQQLTGYSR